MIKDIVLSDNAHDQFYDLKTIVNENEIKIELVAKKNIAKNKIEYLSIKIKLSYVIKSYRTAMYQWSDLSNKEVIISPHSPKIVYLNNGYHFMASKNNGAWVLESPDLIEWVLLSPNLTPKYEFSKNNKSRKFEKSYHLKNHSMSILYTKDNVPEFSRSKIPFKPIICFTDHPDFDTRTLLTEQLSFFEKNKIKISKGFFLNHFSKIENYASYEKDQDLLIQFIEHDHELFYHSLTNSLRGENESLNEFKTFKKPEGFDIRTYVDHGYQLYNLTKINNSSLIEEDWANIMNGNKIKYLWNYLDSGYGGIGVINQLNPSQFTAYRAFKSVKFNIFLF